MSWRGLFTGALTLVALQAVVSSNAAAGRVGDMLEHVADLARRLLDPSVPAIPDLAGAGGGLGETDSPAAAAATATGPPGGDQDRDRPAPRLPRLRDVQSV